MKTKRFLLTTALLGAAFSIPLSTFAQPGAAAPEDRPAPREMRERVGEKMAERLNLTDAQKQQMKALREQHQAAMEALQKDGEQARAQFREKAEALKKQFRDQRRALLTPEQLKIADEMEQKMREHRKERAEHRGPGPRHGRGHGPDDDDAPPPPAPKTE